jgi:hypothetical protein
MKLLFLGGFQIENEEIKKENENEINLMIQMRILMIWSELKKEGVLGEM